LSILGIASPVPGDAGSDEEQRDKEIASHHLRMLHSPCIPEGKHDGTRTRITGHLK